MHCSYLNHDGSRVAVSAPGHPDRGVGYVKVYDYDSNSNKWNQIGQSIYGLNKADPTAAYLDSLES